MKTAKEIIIEHRNYLENDNEELYSEYEIIKAMKEYHNQFIPTDKEIEDQFPLDSEYMAFTYDYIKMNRHKREGAKWARDRMKNPA
jgi:hypothetical protein